MAKTPATYYIRIDTLWANSPDRWVGPFASPDEAQAEINRALGADNSKCVMASQMAYDAKHAIRIYGVASKSQAQRKSLQDYGLGDDSSNVIGWHIPLSTDELFEIEQGQ